MQPIRKMSTDSESPGQALHYYFSDHWIFSQTLIIAMWATGQASADLVKNLAARCQQGEQVVFQFGKTGLVRYLVS